LDAPISSILTATALIFHPSPRLVSEAELHPSPLTVFDCKSVTVY
jgi:hypothetical protein